MAATNFTPIQLYHSTTASAVPLAANLAQGELAINITDGKLYYEDNTGVVQVIATKGAGTIGGSTTQIQYNNAGALAGNAAMVFNSGTSTTTLTTLNLTNALGAIYGGTAQSTYTQGDILYSSASNTLAKLGIGVVNYILTSTGSIPQWVAPSSIAVLTATNLAGGLAGSVPYQSALDTTTFLAIGAANRVMTSTGSAPQWVTSLTGLTGVSSSSITNTSLTSGRIVISSTAGLEADSANLTFNGTTLTTTGLSNSGFSTLVKTLTLGDTSFNGTAVFAPATPAKLYLGTGTVTDVTSAISATNTTGAIASLAITPIAATNTGVTYTNASTLYIAGAPSAGTNITITNPYSLYVAGGAVYLGGNTAVTGTLSATGRSGVTMSGQTSAISLGQVSTDPTYGLLSFNGAFAATTLSGMWGGGGSSDLLINVPTGGSIYSRVANSNVTVLSSTGLAVTGTLSSTLGATIQGLTVGLGAGAVASNTAVGVGALAANTTGSFSTAIGNGALAAQTGTAGVQNIAVGNDAAGRLTTGTQNTAVGISTLGWGAAVATTGTFNATFGQASLYLLTSGSYNTALGAQSLYSNTTASNNTAVGYQAAYSNTTGTFINAFGRYALYYNTTGTDNTGIGTNALYQNTTGSANTALGIQALQANTTASNNTAVGYQAGYSNVTGTENFYGGYLAGNPATGSYLTFVGSRAGNASITGNGNTAVGYYAYGSGTSGASNTAVGVQPLYLNTTGSQNTAIGQEALRSNTTASNNTAVGYQAGYSNTTGAYNSFLGHTAGYTNSTSSYSTYVGRAAGYLSTGTANTFVGHAAGYNSTGSANTFVGTNSSTSYGAGFAMTTGSKNTILGGYDGNQGGLDIRTASNYIVLSDGDGNPRGIFDNGGNFLVGTTSTSGATGFAFISPGSSSVQRLIIGHVVGNTTGDTYHEFNYNSSQIGSITQVSTTGVLYNTTSDYRLKTVVGPVADAGQRIDALKPIDYQWKDGNVPARGFLAHEFQTVYPSSVSGTKDAVDEEGKPVYQSMQASTSEVIADLVAELQSLRARVAQLESKP